MRKHAKSWIINVLIGAIVLVFIFWGVGSFRDREPNYVAVVNNIQISHTEYRDAYRNIYDRVKNQYRQYWNEDMVEILNLKQQTLDSLINEKLLFQEARALNIKVTQQELQENILATPSFQVDGVFSPVRYRSMLARVNYTPEDYELFKRREIAIQKMNSLIIGFAKVSPTEVEEDFHFNKDRVSLEFVAFNSDRFLNQVQINEGELKAYFEKNKENYRVPDNVKVAYLAILPQDFIAEAAADDGLISDYYELNKDKYTESAKVKARHILFKLDQDASDKETARIEEKARAVLKQARTGADFAALAKKYSEDSSAPEGGDLGWFTLDQMVEPFSEAVAKLKKGEISGLVRTQFGFHIIKLEDSSPGGIRSLEDVRDQIAEKLAMDYARELAADRAVEVYEKASLTQDFEGVAREFGLTPIETAFFPVDGYVEGLGVNESFNKTAHSLDEGEIGPLIDLPQGHFLMKVLEKKVSYIPELDEAREEAKRDLTHEKAGELAKERAEILLAVIKKEENWDKVISRYKIKTDFTDPFTRLMPIPRIGTSEELIADVFAATKPGAIGPRVYKASGGYYIVRLKESLPADPVEFEREKERLTRELQVAKSQAYLRQWIEVLRSQATIKIEEGAI